MGYEYKNIIHPMENMFSFEMIVGGIIIIGWFSLWMQLDFNSTEYIVIAFLGSSMYKTKRVHLREMTSI